MTNCPYCDAIVEARDHTCPECRRDLSDEFAATEILAEAQRGAAKMPNAMPPVTRSEAAYISGTVIAGRYRIVSLVGRGGMGEVYKADDLVLNQTVAIKFLSNSVERDRSALARFKSEVRVARQVAHPNVCRVFDIGEIDGAYYLSMEFIEGDDLSMLLRRIGRLPSDKAVETARQLCVGLHAIHDAGILHRDLKPANIIIDSRGRARITDFGIAAIDDGTEDASPRAGTPGYMAPEHLAGNGASEKTDIYVLGLILYEIFTGKPAIKVESLTKYLDDPTWESPTNPSEIRSDIDPVVENVIMKCLADRPEDRPVSALQVAMMLPGGNPLEAAIAAGETPSPEMVAAAPKTGLLELRTATLALAAAVLLLIFNAFIEYRYWVIPTNEKSGEVLVARARTIASNLGYPEKPLDVKYGFGLDGAFLISSRQDSELRNNAWQMMQTGQPSDRVFRYRQSPGPIVPVGSGQVTVDDPVMRTPGDLRVATDPVGRLVNFEVVPIPAFSATGEEPRTDWTKLFVEAELDQSRFTPVSPEKLPPSFADERAAWTGPLISNPSIEVRIEAAAYEGKPVYFSVVMPWSASTSADLRAPPIAVQVITFVLAAAMLIGIVVLSWHNFRTGRGDFRGSVRVMVFFLIVSFFGGLALSDHIPDLWGEMWIMGMVIRDSVLRAAIAGLMYSALEPQLRRLWPEILISWSRLLSGDLRDPLVGRDILLGALMGLAAYSIVLLQFYLPTWFVGKPLPPVSHYFRWDSFVYGFADSITSVANSLVQALVVVFILFIALFISRRRWIALGAIFLLYTALGTANSLDPELVPFNLLMSGLSAATLVVAVKRFGIIGITAHQLFFFMLIGRPFIFNPESIYFEVSISGAIIMLTVVSYGFYVATGGKLFSVNKMLGGEEAN